MTKTFFVLALVAVAGAVASATNYNIAFDGNCDAMELVSTGTPAIYVGGVHDFSGCYGTAAYNEYVGGFRHSFYTSIDPGGSSTVLDLMDPAYGFFYGLPYPLEYLINTDETCAWSSYYDMAGSGHVLAGAGTCTRFTGAIPNVSGGQSTVRPPLQ